MIRSSSPSISTRDARRRRAAGRARPSAPPAAPGPAARLVRRSGGRSPRCRCRSRTRGRAAISSAFSSAKFSMMPLWTTVTRPAVCGWALRVGRRAVGGPAGVADAGRRRSAARSPARASRSRDLARRAAALDARRPTDAGDAGRVVAAVFQPLQALDQPRRRPGLSPTMPMMPHMGSDPCGSRFGWLAPSAARLTVAAWRLRRAALAFANRGST